MGELSNKRAGHEHVPSPRQSDRAVSSGADRKDGAHPVAVGGSDHDAQAVIEFQNPGRMYDDRRITRRCSRKGV